MWKIFRRSLHNGPVMITLATYRNLMAAELAKTRLESHEIQAMIADTFSYTLGYGSVLGGVRLQVPAAEAERAKTILATEESFIDLPDGSTIISEAPETDAVRAGSFKEPASAVMSRRVGGWPVVLLFLLGIFCLILGRPAGDWSTLSSFSGQLILLGVLLMVAGLWIAYGRLSAAGNHDLPPE